MNSEELVKIINSIGLTENDIKELPRTLLDTMSFAKEIMLFNSEDTIEKFIVAIIEKIKSE